MKRYYFAIFYFFLTSCIPAYLPKYNKIQANNVLDEQNLNKIVKKTDIIILTDQLENEENSLGHQYLLGVIPFTSIYLQVSPNSLATEALEDILSTFNFNIIKLNINEYATYANQHINTLAIKPEIKNLSLSGFDLLFFRYLSCSGSLEIHVFKNNQLEKNFSYSLDKSKYKFTAHVHELELLLEKALKDSLIDLISKL